MNSETIDRMLETAVLAVKTEASLADALDRLPAAIYITDRDGLITYYNQACVPLAGRHPVLGKDKWCVTWRIYTTEGEFLPHDQCPMAVAIREGQRVRGVEAVAERPDGSRVPFRPFPTPLFDDAGNVAGAVNLLLDISAEREPAYLREQAERCRRLALSVNDAGVAETLERMAAKYDGQVGKASRLN
jgi:PAS domain S-box-containing protein